MCPRPHGTIEARCPAKLNLALAIGRPDPSAPKGLHPLASWMVAVDLYDQLNVERLDDMSAASSFALRFTQAATQSGQTIDWPLDQDLAYRAHALLESHMGRPLPVRVALTKSIPTGAGLGGGSSNAAAMLVALNQLFDLDLSTVALCKLGITLGSDVPFAIAALTGTPSAIVSGTGQTLEPAPLASPLHVVLVLSEFSCPTAEVFGAFDRLGLGRGRLDTQALHQLTQSDPLAASQLYNDLPPAAADIHPRLGNRLRALTATLGRPAHLTGSGSTC